MIINLSKIKDYIDTKFVSKAQGSGNATKSVCTDSSGNITLEAKNNHTHSYISTSNGSVTLAQLSSSIFETGYSGTNGSKLVPTNDSRLSNARTPTAHTDANGAYGKATDSQWGHTKLGTTNDTAAKGDHTHSIANISDYTTKELTIEFEDGSNSQTWNVVTKP